MGDRPSPLELRVATANYAAARVRQVMGRDLPSAPAGWGTPFGRRQGGHLTRREAHLFVPVERPFDVRERVAWVTSLTHPRKKRREEEVDE